MSQFKQVIAVRTDLNMRKGKLASQVAHASMEFLRDIVLFGWPLTDNEHDWLLGDRVTVVVQIPDEQSLLDLERVAVETGVKVRVFRDKGFTEVAPNTPTAIAIGPDAAHKVNIITGDCRLL